MAAGKVVTGYSKPYVAVYTNEDTTVTYSSGRLLARGVSVTISPETTDEEFFYADNVAAETTGTAFTGGTATLGVDGLIADTEKLIFGLSDADEDGWTHYGESINIPYVGIGFIVRAMSDGTTTYQPVILTKTKFILPEEEPNTQEESIEFQDTELEANIFRDDTENADWKLKGQEFSTESEAEAAIKTFFNITTTTEDTTEE